MFVFFLKNCYDFKKLFVLKFKIIKNNKTFCKYKNKYICKKVYTIIIKQFFVISCLKFFNFLIKFYTEVYIILKFLFF